MVPAFSPRWTCSKCSSRSPYIQKKLPRPPSFAICGLRNSDTTFQWITEWIFDDPPYCSVYIDDIPVYSRSEEDHQGHVRGILQLLENNGLFVRPDKCIFGMSKVEFLGYKISASGVHPLPRKVADISEFPTPTTKKCQQANHLASVQILRANLQ